MNRPSPRDLLFNLAGSNVEGQELEVSGWGLKPGNGGRTAGCHTGLGHHLDLPCPGLAVIGGNGAGIIYIYTGLISVAFL